MADPLDVTAYELAAMSDQLEDYLLSDRLFKTISVATPTGETLIKMTLGGMLERMHELAANAPDAPETVDQARDAMARARRAQADRYFAMLGREAKSYTDSWNWFLQSCWEGERRCQADYPQEVPIRLRLERLLDEGGDHAQLADTRRRLQALDERLRAIWQPSDTSVLPDGESYPRDRYWWLYGRPQPQSD